MAQLNTRIVIRNDSTVNWNTNESVVLLKGEIGIEFLESGTAKLKIGDGTKTWSELDYFGGENKQTQVFQGTDSDNSGDNAVISNITNGATLSSGDIAVISKPLVNDISEKTAYVYDGTNWIALKGNYDAKNVYFSQDLFTTSEIGNITLTNGGANVSAAGKNLYELWETIFVEEKIPTIVLPQASFTSVTTGAKEVGSTFQPTWALKLSRGSYEFGPSTGVRTNSCNITDTEGNSYNGEDMSGFFNNVTVKDNSNYKITAKVNYSEGAIPVTNKGEPYPAGQIKAGSSTVTSGAITGYRNSFYGTVTTKDSITSSIIRGLSGKSNKALSNGSTFNVSIPVGAVRVIIAYPATLRDITSIKDVNGLNAEIKTGFNRALIDVEGANAYSPISYKVYSMDFANPNDTANTYSVQI